MNFVVSRSSIRASRVAGRALVPVGGQGRKGWTATIIATDAPDGIIGFGPASTRKWNLYGEDVAGHGDGDLLPPPPRTVPVVQWALMAGDGRNIQGLTGSAEQADEWRRTARRPVVELTGSYEEPWE